MTYYGYQFKNSKRCFTAIIMNVLQLLAIVFAWNFYFIELDSIYSVTLLLLNNKTQHKNDRFNGFYAA